MRRRLRRHDPSTTSGPSHEQHPQALALLPAGVYQAWASLSKGLWYARSPEIIHSPVMETLVWLRVPGDLVFAGGAVFLGTYTLALLRRSRSAATRLPTAPAAAT